MMVGLTVLVASPSLSSHFCIVPSVLWRNVNKPKAFRQVTLLSRDSAPEVVACVCAQEV
jgi:hypothetical protein